MFFRTFHLALLSFLLVACAPIPPNARTDARNEHARQAEPTPLPPPSPVAAHFDAPSWSVKDLVAVDAVAVGLLREQSTVAILPVAALKAMSAAAERMTRVVELEPSLSSPDYQLVEGFSANAFAIPGTERSVIAANFGMVLLIEDDEAMWAAVIGHELAHLKRQHQKKRTERSEFGETMGGVMSMFLGFIGIPLAPLWIDTATNVVKLGYSREDELEADALAVNYLRAAGYDPVAALRFHQRLAERSGNQSGGVFSTHPGGKERVEAIRVLLAPAAR